MQVNDKNFIDTRSEGSEVVAKRKKESWQDIITIDPKKCFGKPCIRGMRIRVSDVLDLLAHGMTEKKILKEYPDLTVEDIQACLKYASVRLNHRVIRAA